MRPYNFNKPIEETCRTLNELYTVYHMYNSFKVTTPTPSSHHFETTLVPAMSTSVPLMTSTSSLPSTAMINLLMDKDNKSVQINISTSGTYIEIALGVLFAFLLLIVAVFYLYKMCFKPDLTTPRPIRVVRRNLAQRLGLSDIFTPKESRPDQEPILDDANADEIVQMNDVSPA